MIINKLRLFKNTIGQKQNVIWGHFLTVVSIQGQSHSDAHDVDNKQV